MTIILLSIGLILCAGLNIYNMKRISDLEDVTAALIMKNIKVRLMESTGDKEEDEKKIKQYFDDMSHEDDE